MGVGVSLIVIVAAEFVAAKSGIGYLIWASWGTLIIEKMFVGSPPKCRAQPTVERPDGGPQAACAYPSIETSRTIDRDFCVDRSIARRLARNRQTSTPSDDVREATACRPTWNRQDLTTEGHQN